MEFNFVIQSLTGHLLFQIKFKISSRHVTCYAINRGCLTPASSHVNFYFVAYKQATLRSNILLEQHCFFYKELTKFGTNLRGFLLRGQ